MLTNQSIDKIMQYLRDNLHVLCDKLEQTMIPLVLEQVWEREIRALQSTLLPGVSCYSFFVIYILTLNLEHISKIM